jgi:hypothetical protein
MARIINRTTPEIIANNRHSGLDFITIKERGFYFPKNISFELKVSASRFIHFINDDDYWCFYVNDDKDGFKFSLDKGGSYMINDRALSRMFIKSTNMKNGDRLLVKSTKTKNNGATVYEIHTKETIDVYITKKETVRKRKEHTLWATKSSAQKSLPERETA